MAGAHQRRIQDKRVGLIGGMSWRSTALYYERLNRAVERACGPHHGFVGQVCNLDYSDLLARVTVDDWDGIAGVISGAAQGLAKCGCDVIALTAVTAHRWHDAIRTASDAVVPHVLAGAARELDQKGFREIGVLGTRLTCASDFVRDYLGAPNRGAIFLDDKGQAEIDHLIQSILTTGDDRAGGEALLSRAIGPSKVT